MDEQKYQVGDIVRVREDAQTNELYFNPAMEELKGMEFEIRSCDGFIDRFDSVIYRLITGDGHDWQFREDWLDPVDSVRPTEEDNKMLDGFLSEFL